MKIKNLFIVPLLGAALVATSACSPSAGGSTSGSEASTSTSSEPQKVVTRISIKSLTEAVVGDELDLDTLVDVYYDDGSKSKDYTLEAQAASADLVSINGHKVTFLKEGNVNINVKAGETSAKFSTTAMSVLKAAFKKETASLSDTWAMLGATDAGQLYPRTVHRPDYTYFEDWDEDEDKNSLFGGFLQAKNGKTYQYVLNASGEIEVDPTVYGDFNNYYCNFPFLLDASDFESVELEDPTTGEKTPALVMSKDVIGTWGASFAPNKAAEFAYTNAIALNSAYGFGDTIVTQVSLPISEEVVLETFAIELQVLKLADESVVDSYEFIMYNDVETTEVTPVREYIDSGKWPIPMSYDEFPVAINTIATAKKYTATTHGSWYNPTTGEEVAAPTDTGYWIDQNQYGSYFSCGDEIDYVNESTIYQTIDYGESGTLVTGKISHEGQNYTFNNISGQSLVDTLTATVGEGTDVWASYEADTIASINKEALFTDFTVTGREESLDGTITITTDGGNCSTDLITNFLKSTYLGYDVATIGNGLSFSSGAKLIEYYDVELKLTSTGELSITVSFVWDSTLAYGITTTYSAVGADNVPAKVADIVYPQPNA